MRNVIKKIAILLIIILVFNCFNFNMSSKVSAATKPSWSNITSSKKTIYVGNSFTLNIKNKISGSKYKWSTSNADVVSVNNSGKIFAKKIGKATIKCVIGNSKSTKTYATLTASITVKESASSISISNPVSTLDVKANAYDFNVTTKTNSGDNTTDQTYWLVTDNSAGATVDNDGVVSTVNVGEFKIQAVTATSDTNFKAGKYTAVSEILNVKVPIAILSVRQSSDQKVELTFNANVTNIVKQADFTIINANTYANQPIKSINYSSDGKTVYIETYITFTNAYSYKLTYAGKDYQFQTSNGDIASIVLKTDRIPYGVASPIDYALYDAKGTDITASKNNTAVIDIELLSATNGYIDSNKKLTLFAKGDTARIKITYHTFKYVNGSEVTITTEGIITAVDQTQVNIGNYEKYTITKTEPNWSTLSSSVSTLSTSDTDLSIFVLAKDTANKQIPNSSITFSSSDNTKLLVSQNGSLCPLKEGNVYVIATIGSITWTLPVTIVGERKASSIAVDKPVVTVSNSTQANNYATVKVTVKDQYGDSYKPDTLYISSAVEANSRVGAPTPVINGTSVNFYGAGAKTGEYNFIITVEDKKISVIVRVEEPALSQPSVFNIELSNNNIDMAITQNSQLNDKSIRISVGEYKGSVLYNYRSLKTVIITKPDGTEIKQAVNGTIYTFETVTATTGGLSKVPVGTYKVVATILDDTGRDINLTSYFKVYDSQQTLVSYSVNALVTYKNTIRTAIADCITIKDNSGNLVDSSNIVNVSFKSPTNINSIDSQLASGTQVYIDTITVQVKYGNYYIQQIISIGQTFTFK